MSGVETVRCTYRPDLFIFRGFLHLPVQEQLDRTPDIIAVFPTPVIDITIYRLHT